MSTRETARGAAKVLVDLGPVVAFVLSFNVWNRADPDFAIFGATIIFMAATAAVAVYSFVRTRTVPAVTLASTVIVLAFGAVTLVFRNDSFIKLKPTIVYLFYAATIFGAMAVGKNIWKMLFGHAFTLPDSIWRILAVRWGLFFVAMAMVNEIIRLTQSTDFWVNSRLFVGFPMTAAFMALNLPITLKHIGRES